MRQTASGGFVLTRAELLALMTHASSDETRAHLHSVCFDVGRGRIVTTDGHRLSVCQARAQIGPQPALTYLISLADCKAIVRVAKQKVHTICFDVVKRPDPDKEGSVCSVEVRIVDTSIYTDPDGEGFPEDLIVRMKPRPVSAQFPPVDQVLRPLPHKGQAATGWYCVNASYLADIAVVVKAGSCNDRTGGVQLFLPEPSDVLGPMLATVKGDDCDWTVLLMPMREIDPREAAPEPEEEPEPVPVKAAVVPLRRRA